MRAIAGLVISGLACLAGMIIMMGVSVFGVAALPGGGQQAASRHAVADIPRRMRELYESAAATCPGLPWSVLAAIGKVETDHGRARDQVSDAGAVGPMQFLPATFGQYAQPIPPGGERPASPWDRTDAVYAAARLLCRNGADAQPKTGPHNPDSEDDQEDGQEGLSSPGIGRAVLAYNPSRSYVAAVLRIARSYQRTAAAGPGPGSRAGRRAAAWALTQRGKPYAWGADGPGSYDCSGLTMRAWQHTGVTIPRTTYDQARIGTPVPRDALQAGDLVFFRPGANGPEHVGLYLGHGQMVEAPHTGDVVKIAPIGRDDYAGARRPTG